MNKSRKKVVGIGELLWDVLPTGKQLGGAPCNFAYHAQQVGCSSFVVSAIGNDDLGNEILETLKSLGIDHRYVSKLDAFPTGTVSVELDAKGNPSYIIHENTAWDNIHGNGNIEELARETDAVCFGSLAQRNTTSQQCILSFLKNTPDECLRVFDINLRQSFFSKETILNSLQLANVLKLNEDELPVVSNYLNLKGDEENILNKLLIKYDLKLIALTKGDKGSMLITDTERSYCEVPQINVADTVGAGDSFTAVLIAGMLNNMNLKKLHKAATDIAAYVCTQKGATPVLPSHLIKQLN